MKLIDNINHLLGDDLQEQLVSSSNNRIKIAASYFSIYAFHILKEELEGIDSLQFIFTSPTFVAENVVDKLKKEKREYVIQEPLLDTPHCQNSCHPHLNNPNGEKGDNHGTIQCRTQTGYTKQTFIT